MAHVLAPAFTPHRKAGPSPNCGGSSDPHPQDDHGEPTLGSAQDPGGACAAWVQSFGRTVAKYMQRTHRRGPSTTWRSFLRQNGSEIWACDFCCVRTITFRTLYVFFVINHASRQVLHVHVTPHPTASWTAQQIVECCAWERVPARFLVHDRDSCYGATFHRRVRTIGAIGCRPAFAHQVHWLVKLAFAL